MHVFEKEEVVLQAIIDRICSVGQWTPKASVLGDIVERRGEEFISEKSFNDILKDLFDEWLIEHKTINGEPHLTVTRDVLKVENLMTDCLF